MTTVKIGELRSRLSRYLKRVQAGQEIVICDRERRIGRVVPYAESDEAERFDAEPPIAGHDGLRRLRFAPLKTTRPFDAVEALVAERRRR